MNQVSRVGENGAPGPISPVVYEDHIYSRTAIEGERPVRERYSRASPGYGRTVEAFSDTIFRAQPAPP